MATEIDRNPTPYERCCFAIVSSLGWIMFIAGTCLLSPDRQPILFWLSILSPILIIAYINLIVSSVNIIAVSIHQSFVGNCQLILLILRGIKMTLRGCFGTSTISDETTVDASSARPQESGGTLIVPIHRYEKEVSDDDGPMCCICKELFEPGDSVTQLPACSHTFHGICCSKWLQLSMTCPVCRCRVAYMDQKSVEDL